MYGLKSLRVKWNRRPWPSSVGELRACRVSYSQFAEDLLATTLLGYERTDGYYVDVGCFHPIRFSNTYIFYRRGWRGVCIDPSPAARRAWKRMRPRDVFKNVGIASSPGELLYLSSSSYPACNKLVALGEAGRLDGSIFDRELRVPVQRLEVVLEHTIGTAGPSVDLMSVDCEGRDLDVLRSNNFERFRPRVMIVEDHETGTRTPITEHCEGLGYSLSCICHLSKIFVDSAGTRASGT